MDYIREELLRQQALLVVLLTGQRMEPLEEAGQQRTDSVETTWEPETELSLQQMNVRSRQARARFEDSGDEAAFLWTALAAAGTTVGERRSPEPEELRETAAGQKVKTNAAAVVTGRGGVEIPAETGRAAGIFPAEAGEVRLVTELRQTERGEPVDPAALSRAFQRDARRYDGGFRLY